MRGVALQTFSHTIGGEKVKVDLAVNDQNVMLQFDEFREVFSRLPEFIRVLKKDPREFCSQSASVVIGGCSYDDLSPSCAVLLLRARSGSGGRSGSHSAASTRSSDSELAAAAGALAPGTPSGAGAAGEVGTPRSLSASRDGLGLPDIRGRMR